MYGQLQQLPTEPRSKTQGRSERPRPPTPDGKARIDTQWFRGAISDRELSMRKVARLMHLDPSAVSLMLRGRRGMGLQEAAELATILQVPIATILSRAGIKNTDDGKRLVPLVGAITNERVHLSPAPETHVAAPDDVPLDGAALVVRAEPGDPMAMQNGWLYYLSNPTPGSVADCIGRFGVAKIKGDALPVVAFVRRSHDRTRYDLICARGAMVQAAEVEWAEPILWMRP